MQPYHKFILNVPTSTQSSEIFIGNDLIKEIVSNKISFIILDSAIKNTSILELSNRIKTLIIQGGEQSKDIATLIKIWEFCGLTEADKDSVGLIVGGGAVCDVASFALSTYYRGINYYLMPTTLLSQVDAAIGGKNAINLGTRKNIIGTINQPKSIFIDTVLLESLPERELRSGLAEMIKHGAILDKKHLTAVFSIQNLLIDLNLIDIISRSVELKIGVITEDPYETGVRSILNFGHTIGHAIEGIFLKSKSQLLHGEAISIGMVAEGFISMKVGGLSEPDLDFLIKGIKNLGLPTQLVHKIEIPKIIDYIRYDKKNRNGAINWVLLETLGKAKFNIKVDELIVEEALRFIGGI